MKLDILAFGAHPDDVELGCAATLAKEISMGKKVGIVDLTRGELGTRGTVAIRTQEALSAAKIIGAVLRENMGFEDGFFINDKAHQMAIVEIIRKYQPEVVLCNAVDDRHLDHPKGSQLVSDACFLSGLRKITTKVEDISQAAWRPKQVYHYMQWKNTQPDFVVDVTGFMDVKERAVKAHASQFFDPNSKEPESPITSQNFINSVLYRANDLGRMIGVESAEGFSTERYVAVRQLGDLI
ncbi:MAG: bacillithiol biosynthesis deacetylase BshB1 [Polaribacter sp.]|jgi:bacillithiol biosynthesis deacetylase BshB1|nr:bacillithiol biosynthesis deacetylase BshB1 [Polaribacter sp.]